LLERRERAEVGGRRSKGRRRGGGGGVAPSPARERVAEGEGRGLEELERRIVVSPRGPLVEDLGLCVWKLVWEKKRKERKVEKKTDERRRRRPMNFDDDKSMQSIPTPSTAPRTFQPSQHRVSRRHSADRIAF
jgi:hypothetical protein